MTDSTTDHKFHHLANGHKLCYQLFGDSGGFPILYCHGFPGSRLDAAIADKAASKLNACIIAVDRPGFGQSDFQPQRQMNDWVGDMNSLMMALQHDRYSVLAVSGGAPYGMLLAEHLSENIHRLSIVCGLGNLSQSDSDNAMGLIQRLAVKSIRAFPKLVLLLNRYISSRFINRFPNIAFKIAISGAPKVDREALMNEETKNIILASAQEAFRQGGEGAAWDIYLATQHWQANLLNIKTKTYLWHGELDTTVPIEMAYEHAKHIPHCQTIFLPKEGHFSLPLNHIKTILSQLIK